MGMHCTNCCGAKKKTANVQDLMKFDKTINLFALVGYETSYSQRVGYLPSHIQRALME